jgi:hypothetical protein
MTSLINQLPESTFGDLLTTTNNGQGLPVSVPVPVQDGLGNNSPITMSQNTVNFNTTGGNNFQINGVNLTASASDLNETTSKYLVASGNVRDAFPHILFTVPVSPYDPLNRHYVIVQAVISVLAINNLNMAGILPNPITVIAYQTSTGLQVTGEIAALLTNVGLNDPNVAFLTSGNNLQLTVQELNSAVTNTFWIANYAILASN